MKLLYIWHAGVEKEYRYLFKEIARQGTELTVITAEKWIESSKKQYFQRDDSIDRNYRIYPLKTVFTNHIRSFFYLNIFKIVFILLKARPDFIYIKEEPFSSACFEIMLLCGLFVPKAKISIESDENLPVRHPVPYKWFEKFVLRKIFRLAVVSKDGIGIYKDKGAGNKLYKTTYFVNTDRFKPMPFEESIRYFPEMAGKKFKIGFAARIAEEKGIDTLILSLKYIKGLVGNFSLYIAGAGNENYIEELRKLILNEGCQDYVYFLGSLGIDKLPYFYNCLDVLVLPSKTKSWWKEQFGRVIIECQACGTPVIGSSSGGNTRGFR